MSPPRKNLLALVESRGTNLAAVSRAIGRNHAYLHQFMYRGIPRSLNEHSRENLGKFFNVSPNIFRHDAGEVNFDDLAVPSFSEDLDLVEVPEIEALSLFMGPEENSNKAVVSRWTIPKSSLGSMRNRANNLLIVSVGDDCMEPAFRMNDKVLINTADRSPSPAGTFLIWDGLGASLRQVEVILPSQEEMRIKLTFFNKKYADVICPLKDIKIAGRVMAKWSNV